MDEQRKALEAVGDGLLLAYARLYLYERRESVPYTVHTRIICQMVRNSTLEQMAKGEGIKGREGEKLSDAFEVSTALRYFRYGFEDVRAWLCSLFGKYLNVEAEAERILNPPPEDALTKSVRGALKMVIGQNGGKITGSTLDLATKQIVGQLRSNGNSH
jgi:dsRNA-specific ribonuclease